MNFRNINSYFEFYTYVYKGHYKIFQPLGKPQRFHNHQRYTDHYFMLSEYKLSGQH